MAIRSMNFTFEAQEDSSKELKDALIRGIDAFTRTGRVVTEAKANEIVRPVETMQSGGAVPAGRRRTGAGGGRGGRGRTPKKVARWAQKDLDALKELDWETLDAIWEQLKDGTITDDSQLKGDQRRAITAAYNRVPGDKRAERSERANVIGRLKHLVSAYEAAEAQGWKAGS